MRITRARHRFLTVIVFSALAAAGFGASGCAELQGLLAAFLAADPNDTDPNGSNDPNDPNDTDASARAVFFIQGRAIDDFSELNVTVSQISFVSGDGDAKDDEKSKTVELSPGVRINLLATDAAEFIACLDDAPVGDFTKLRLTISDPEFVQTDDTVIPADKIRLAGNGKLDLNTQNGKFSIEEGVANFIVFTVQAGDNAFMVTETGNGVFNLRSEAFVDAGDVDDIDVAMTGVVQTTDDVNTLVIDSPECNFAVIIGTTTQITRPGGGVGTVTDIDVGETISIVGEANVGESLILAGSITIQE